MKKNVVIDKVFKNIYAIKKLKDKKMCFTFSPSTSKLKSIMLESDVAISACGQTLYELARVGVPTIAIAVANNQLFNVKGWKRRGFIEYAGWYQDKNLFLNLKRNLKRLSSAKVRADRSRLGRSVIDGKGPRQIVAALLGQNK